MQASCQAPQIHIRKQSILCFTGKRNVHSRPPSASRQPQRSFVLLPLDPVVQEPELFGRVKVVLAALHDRHAALVFLTERVEDVPFGQIVVLSVQDGGRAVPPRDRVIPHILVVLPRQRFAEGRFDPLLVPKAFFGDVRPAHHVADQPLHVEDRRDEQAARERDAAVCRQAEVRAQAARVEREAPVRVRHRVVDGAQVADAVLHGAGVRFARALAVFGQVEADDLIALCGHDAREGFRFFLSGVSSVNEEKRLLGRGSVNKRRDAGECRFSTVHRLSSALHKNYFH